MTVITPSSQAQRAVLALVEDASHAWLAVSLDTEHGCPAALDFASSYSYLDITGDNFAGIVYLEEDVDAVNFVKHFGVDLAGIREVMLPEDSNFRDLPRAK